MSVQASAWVIQNSQHKGSDLLCLLMIANHAHSDGTNAFPSVPTLAKECRMSARQITRIIQNLEGSGELRVQRSEGRHAHTFTVVMQALVQPLKPDPANLSPSKNGNNLAPTLPTCQGNPDISHTPTLTNPTFNPDIFDTCIYDAPALDLEPSIEPSIEKNKRGETPCARPAKVERIRKKDNVLTGVHVAIHPPTLDEIKAWLTEHKHDPRHAVAFFSHYGANGWYQNGGKPVYSWPHALAGWVDREKQFDNGARQTSRSSTPLVGGTLANAGHVQVKRPADWKPITLEEATRRDKEYAAQVAAKRESEKRQADALRNGS